MRKDAQMRREFKPSKRYLKAYAGLYGNEAYQPPLKTTRKPNTTPTEDQEQFALVKWLRAKRILFYHIPNQREANVQYGVKLKALGVSKGVPDICIPVSRKGYHGLFLELKRTIGGVISEEQAKWLADLNAEGYKAVVAKGAEEAIKIIEDYFK